MVATLVSVDALLKEVYEGDVNNQLDEERKTVKRIRRTDQGVIDGQGGKFVVFPVRTKRNTGISYRSEGEQLAAAGKQGYARPIEYLKYGYGRFALSGQAMDTAETNPHSFMSTLDGEMDGLKEDIAKDENRITIGHPDSSTAGATGIVGKVVSAAAQVITVDNAAWFDIDEELDLRQSNGTLRSADLVVTDIDDDANEVTVTGTLTGIIAGDYLTRRGNWDREPFGFNTLIGATGTVHGIDSTAAGNSYWQSTIDSTTTTLTEQSMTSVCDKIRKKGGGTPTALFCSLGYRNAYHNLFITSRRFNEPKEFSGGLHGLVFNYGRELPVVDDVDIPPKTCYYVNEKKVKVRRNKDWFFEDRDGAVLKWVTDYDQFQGMMKCYWQMTTEQRNAHGAQTNITEPA